MNYKCLSKQTFENGGYKLVPIREEDKYEILEWRNQQIFHLRQTELLTKESQDYYFETVISKLFQDDKPGQILFSYLQGEKCIGYGGLVHINWVDKNAEISFLMNTSDEEIKFEYHWINYLKIIEIVAFQELKFHKIFTFAFDLRTRLYKALLISGYYEESRLKEHCFFEGRFIDVLIHSKLNDFLNVRNATIGDIELYFEWANDIEVRSQSFSSNTIDWVKHKRWFKSKLNSDNCRLFVFENHIGNPVGQVRFENEIGKESAIIGISISKNFRGLKLGHKLILKASALYLEEKPNYTLKAYIKNDNLASIKSFEQAGYIFSEYLTYQGKECSLYIK